MPPEERFVVRFAAEPPQEGIPYGRWAETLQAEFLAACLRIDAEDVDVGEPEELVYYPDRTWADRCYVPVTARTTTGLELFGYVSFLAADPEAGEPEPSDFDAHADFTEETADAHPEWQIDINEEVVGRWRGEHGNVAAMTLVWGRPLTGGVRTVTAELAGLVVDQCVLVEDRFTLLAPDDYRGDFLEVALWDSRNEELARESLYEDDGEDEHEEPEQG
jgi:hypothetical protein